MAEAEPSKSPLRVWPGVAAVGLQWLAWLGAPLVLSGEAGGYVAAVGLLAGALAIVTWWLFFSRARWLDRLGALALMAVALAVTPRFLHESVAKGNLGLQFFLYALPTLSLAFILWALVTRRLAERPRRATMAAAIALACGLWTLVRSEGLTGDGRAQFVWRWSRTPEERLLARAGQPEETRPVRPDLDETRVDWPGFRGAARDGVIAGPWIEVDWAASPPVELWRRPIGPGVSSFAVGGDLFYTQEQRGEDEIVAGYRLASGEPVWSHRDAIRFWDPHVGAGPRATPALAGGRVYALGAEGILNALDARDGNRVWSRDVASDAGAAIPEFGFTSSPLVIDDLVVVAVGRLAAYDLATGALRWLGPPNGGSYSSPQAVSIDGVSQLLLLGRSGLTSVAPADGARLWEHALQGTGIVQPAQADNGDILITVMTRFAAPVGTRSLAVAHRADGWKVEERWTSTGLKPSFSSFVVHRGHAFGFDGRILACIELGNGERRWKGGRYGSGQLVVLPEQDLLLVVSEQGEVALVSATPERFVELARFPALEGKTWNQPAMVGDVLLLRNGREMAAFRLPSEGRAAG